MDEISYYLDDASKWSSKDKSPSQSEMLTFALTMLSEEVLRGAVMPDCEALRLREALDACAAVVHAPDYHSSQEYWMQFLAGGRASYPDRAKHWWWWVILPNAK